MYKIRVSTQLTDPNESNQPKSAVALLNMGPQPFQISIPDPRIADLKTRLSLASFPSELDDAGWDYGAPLADIKRLTSHWKDEFDWRKAEKQLNETLPQFTTEVTADGFEALTIHFVHQRSDIRNAIPLLFIHGCMFKASFLAHVMVIAWSRRVMQQERYYLLA